MFDLRDITDYYDNEVLSDMIIRVEVNDCVRDIFAHSIIMASWSPVFKTWSISQLRKNNIFIIKGHDVSVVEFVVKWAYGYACDEIITKEQYINMLAITHYLQIYLFDMLSNNMIRFNKYYNNANLSDMVIRVGVYDIYVHTIIIASVSYVIETWFDSTLRKNNIFEIIDHTFDVVEYVIRWAYGYVDEITSKEQYINILSLSNFMQMKLFDTLVVMQWQNSEIYCITLTEMIQMAYLYNSNEFWYIIREKCWEMKDVICFDKLTNEEYTELYKRTGGCYDRYNNNNDFLCLLDPK